MNITISDPTPAPEMPVMWACVWPTSTQGLSPAPWVWGGVVSRHKESMNDRATGLSHARLIKIDPNAPSFEPGPTEWVDSKGYVCRVSTEDDALTIHDGFGVADFPATIADIDHLIRALLAAREQVAHDAARKGKG